MNTFITLLKREYWEHRGGMLWTPLIVGGLMTLFATGGLLFGLVLRPESRMKINGMIVQGLEAMKTQEVQDQIAEGISMTSIPTMMPLFIAMVLVIVFYALASLYDDRKDRSILFWKSMPVSDTATVLSKLTSILFITPSITLAVGICTSIILTVITLAAIGIFTGVNVIPEVLTSKTFYLAPLALIATLPVYFLWALPSIAWFMLVSAWAKRVPIVWSIGVPVLTGALLSWQQLVTDVNLGAVWFWEKIVGRLFGSLIPGMWFGFSGGLDSDFDKPDSAQIFVLLGESWKTLAMPTVWIGLIIGVAMLVLAIRLRRWREDAG